MAVLVIAVLYLLTISVYAGGGDSGELIVTALNLAAPHPPGYPLYTFMGHAFSKLPFSTPAWRLNFFSLCAQVACAGILYSLAKDWLKRKWIASLAVLFFCLAPLTWRYAIEAEVFALNNLFAAVLLLLLYRYHHSKQLRIAYAACAVLGLAACHHMTILMFAFPLFCFYLWRDRAQLLRPRAFLTCTAVFILCLSPYLLLFILGRDRTLIAWGDFSTWEGWLTHVFRKEYGFLQLARDGKENGTFLSKIFIFVKEMGVQTYVVMGLAAILGFVNATRASFAFALSIGLVFYALVFHALSNLNLFEPLFFYAQSRMWMLPLMLTVLLGGFGLSRLPDRMDRAVAAAFLAILTAGTAWNWRHINQRDNDFFERAGRAMLEALEPKAVLFMREDAYVNAIRYLQTVHNLRPDVRVIPFDNLWWPWMKELVQKSAPEVRLPGDVMRYSPQKPGEYTPAQLLDANVDHAPLYIAKLSPEEVKPVSEQFIGFPYGYYTSIKRPGATWTLPEATRGTAPFLSLELPLPGSYHRASWEAYLIKNYFDVKIPMAMVFVKHEKGSLEWTRKGIEILNAVAKENNEYKPEALKYLGAVQASLAPTHAEFREPALKAWMEYLATNPPETDEIKNVRAALEHVRKNGWRK